MEKPPITRSELVAEARRLLASLDSGVMSASAYDTAWVARLRKPNDPEEPLFPETFDWLLRHQRPDGSWGADIPFPHDRVVSTLAAVVTLAGSTYRKAEAEVAVRRGVLYLNRERPNLRDDPAETVGFELVLPELVRQAQALGLRLPYADWAFVEEIKADKLRRIPPIAVYGGPTPLTHSLEYLGDRLAPMLVQRCQSPNGSYGASPAATAYVLSHVTDDHAVSYLKWVIERSSTGGVPFFFPFTIYELTWGLRALFPLLSRSEEYRRMVERLESYWTPGGMQDFARGVMPDLDTTTMAAQVLHPMGTEIKIEVFALFEADEYFYCYAFERNPSVTTNAHLLEVLRHLPSSIEQRRMMLKVLHFLRKARDGKPFWYDKWHASPYYATEAVIRASAGLANDLIRPAVQWILENQHEDGSWGFAGGNAEETALAALALIEAAREDPALPSLIRVPLERAYHYLALHWQDEVPSLWIGKALYSPSNIVRATILGAFDALYGFFNPS